MPKPRASERRNQDPNLRGEDGTGRLKPAPGGRPTRGCEEGKAAPRPDLGILTPTAIQGGGGGKLARLWNLLEALRWLADNDGKKAKAIFVGGERTTEGRTERRGHQGELLASLARSF